MTPAIIQALQAALDAQFKAGAAIGRLETLMDQAMPPPTEPPAETPPVEQPPASEALKNHPQAPYCGTKSRISKRK